ncbi:MAG: hypothetical protein RLZZ15_4424, partial [Verrucomicrobiota bacterium]
MTLCYLPLNHAFAGAPARRARPRSRVADRVFKATPKLSDLFRECEFLACKGPLDRPFAGLTTDSRRVLPGYVFFALPGAHRDGAGFIDDAINRGATAVVTSARPSFVPPNGVTFVRVAHARAALALAAQRHFQHPDRELPLAAVTGTADRAVVAHV